MRARPGAGPLPPPAPPGEPFSWRGRPFRRFAWGPETAEGPEPLLVADPIAGRYQPKCLFTCGEGSALVQADDLRTRHNVLLKTTRVDTLVPAGVDADALALELRRARHHLQAERRLLVRLRNAGCTAVPHPHDYVHDVNPALAADGSPEWRSDRRPAVEEALVATEPYLVLQHLVGTTLDELAANPGFRGMPAPEAIRLMRPVVETLALLHEPWRLESGRIWHCVYQDLKPANILVDPLGRPTLLDFSGCQVVVDGVLALQGSFTPGYSAPECADPGRVLLPCADVYSIGATLYHLLTGTAPTVRSPDRVSSPPDLRTLPQPSSPGLIQLIQRCLAPRPSDRYADAAQVARAMDDFAANQNLAKARAF